MTLYVKLGTNLLCGAFSIDYSMPGATDMKNGKMNCEGCKMLRLVNINANTLALIRECSHAWAQHVEPKKPYVVFCYTNIIHVKMNPFCST